MKIFGTIIFEYILGYILQGFAYILGIYSFSMKKMNIKKYLMACVIFILVSYTTRLLPINLGIHTILDLICIFVIGTQFLRMPILSTIRSLLIVTILLLFAELFSVFVINGIYGREQIILMMSDSLLKSIIALPSSILFALSMFLSYCFMQKTITKRAKDEAAC